MRIFELKQGGIDVRYEPATDRFCLVFDGVDVKLFRTMQRDEAEAFAEFLLRRLKETSNG